MKRFQLHLSTLLLLTIIAALFLWSNVRTCEDSVHKVISPAAFGWGYSNEDVIKYQMTAQAFPLRP